MDRTETLAALESAKAELMRCMGGVDPDGAIVASKRITEYRNALRDNPLMIKHLSSVIEAKP